MSEKILPRRITQALRKIENYAESIVAAANVWVVAVVTMSYTTIVGTTVPTAAAERTIRTTVRSDGIRLRTGTIRTIPVITPLPDIPSHII